MDKKEATISIGKLSIWQSGIVVNTDAKENKLIIKGLGISLEELQSRGDAQKELIRLHNDMYDAIGDLEARLNELED